MLSKVLEEIGLNNSEIKVYLALLELGEAKSGEILKKANSNSGRIYEVFDSLLKKGFISYVIKSGTKYFSPANPKKILNYIDEKEESVIKQKEDFKLLLPDILTKLNSKKEETKVEVYLGLNGIKSAYEKEVEYTKKTGFVNILGVTSRENYSNKVYDFFVFNQQPKRKSLKIKIKKIINTSSRQKRENEHEKEADIRYFDFTSPVSYTITKGLVIIGIHSDEESSITIVIESEKVSESFIQQFELLWKISKK